MQLRHVHGGVLTAERWQDLTRGNTRLQNQHVVTFSSVLQSSVRRCYAANSWFTTFSQNVNKYPLKTRLIRCCRHVSVCQISKDIFLIKGKNSLSSYNNNIIIIIEAVIITDQLYRRTSVWTRLYSHLTFITSCFIKG